MHPGKPVIPLGAVAFREMLCGRSRLIEGLRLAIITQELIAFCGDAVPDFQTGASPNTRIDALDALRAAAMLLGVFLHASVAYLHQPVPGLVWLVNDPSPSWAFDLLFWYLHGFRIPLFFLVAGFFAALLCDLRGPRAYLEHRLKRIGAPLLGAALVILPPTYLLWGLGLVGQDIVSWREVLRGSYSDQVLKHDLMGLGHLWFLQYLLIYSVVYFALRRWLPGVLSIPARVRFLDAWWRPLPWVILTFGLLWIRPEIFTRFENRWTPEPWGLAYYGLFFFVGTRVHRVSDRLDRLIPTGRWFVVASIAVFAPVFVMLQWRAAGDSAPHANTWVFACAAALFCWLGVLGFLGLCLEGYKTISPHMRFVADAAYWIYLVHVFLVGLTQLLIHWAGQGLNIGVPRSLGFTLAVGCAFAVGLASYRYAVRYGVIGEWLHGKKVKCEAVDRAEVVAKL